MAVSSCSCLVVSIEPLSSGLMFVLLRGALWLERRAVNLVNFLCCGQVLYGFAASPTSLDVRVDKVKIS